MSDLLIAADTVDLTPQRPMTLGGYSRRTSPFQSISDRLEANLLMVRHDRHTILIVSVDLLYPGRLLRENLLKALDLRQEELFLAASHTHYAPMTAPDMPLLGAVDQDYADDIAQRITKAVRSLKLQHASDTCRYHEGSLDHSINRRLVCLRIGKSGVTRSVGMGPNRAGERDESVRVLGFVSASGALTALLWNYACHASDAVDSLKVSAAYPGRVRQLLRAEFGDVPVVFLQGFSGDVRPPFSGVRMRPRNLVARALRGPQFKIPTNDQWRTWSASMAEAVCAICRTSPELVPFRSPVTRRIELSEREFAADGNGDQSLFWHLVDFTGFQLVGINAEPVVRYRQLIRHIFGESPFFTAGCLDQTRCYLPTDDMIAAGGYEVSGFRNLFGFEGHFQKQIESRVVRKLEEIAS